LTITLVNLKFLTDFYSFYIILYREEILHVTVVKFTTSP